MRRHCAKQRCTKRNRVEARWHPHEKPLCEALLHEALLRWDAVHAALLYKALLHEAPLHQMALCEATLHKAPLSKVIPRARYPNYPLHAAPLNKALPN